METTNAEFAREVYANSLSVAQIAPIIEAEKFSQYADTAEYDFCERMARIYGCVPKNGDEWNLMKFLVTIYHYGTVQGVRDERKKRGRYTR
jgi:hypothetical protein